MLDIEFKRALKNYKELKNFLINNFNMTEFDSFDIKDGVLNIVHFNFGEYYMEEIPLRNIVSKLDKNVIF